MRAWVCVRRGVCISDDKCFNKFICLGLFLQVMHIVLLVLYSYVILFSFEKPLPSAYERVLIGWIGTMIWDEIRQVRTANIKLLVHWTSENNSVFFLILK